MGKESILIVDDEKNILEALQGILTDEGYKVFTAESGDEALEVLEQQPCDIILLDVWLPGRRDGLQTLREIRKRNLNTQVIMISGHGSIDTAVRATKLGAFDFVEKPLSLDSILGLIESALQKSDAPGEGEPAREGLYTYIAGCPAMKKVKAVVAKASALDEPLLISGEQGCGKEYTAKYIHSLSARKEEPFIKVSCRQLTSSAFDRLFGSADEDVSGKDSRFSSLSGTVFLGNLNFLDEALQKRLATLIELAKGRESGPKLAFVAAVVVSPGRKKSKKIHKSLAAVFKTAPAVELPPLRERRKDIKALINYFMGYAAEDFGKTDIQLSKKAMSRMESYPWTGNVKELQTVVENMVMTCASTMIEPGDIPFGGLLEAGSPTEVEKIASRKKRGSGEKSRAISQKTLGQSVVLCGLGLHSGMKTGLILAPLPPNSGIIFGDISTGRQVIANLDNVESTDYSTTLKFGSASVKTIEHIMATLHMYGITNALIKVGEEVPIMDGSAAQLCELVENAGVIEQEETIEPIRIKKPFLVGEKAKNKKYLLIEPADRLEVEYRMDYPQPVGRQSAIFKDNGVQSFKIEVAPARTFGFVHQIKEFEGKGFAEGGKLSNIILLDEKRIINTTLRFEDEFAKHKILDILGDIYLLGRPLFGKITANMTGHSDNIMLLKKIRHSLEKNESSAGARQ